MQKRVWLWDLFWTFFKIGGFTFGGGYAMLSLIEREVVENKQWATDSDMMNMLIIAESTPGVLAVNMATSCGFRTRGVIGSIVATLGVILPSFVIILALSFFLTEFEQNFWFKAAFSGIQICVCTLILNAFLKVSRSITNDVYNYVALVTAFAVALFTNFNIIFVILIGGFLGATINILKQKLSKKKPLPIENTLYGNQDEQPQVEQDKAKDVTNQNNKEDE